MGWFGTAAGNSAAAGGLSAGGASVLQSTVPAVVSATGSGIFGSLHAKKSHKRNIEAWHLANAYNHPKEQMKRLREAGINPHLAYGGKGPSNVSAGQPAAHKAPSSPDFKMDSPLAGILVRQNIRNVSADTQKKNMDALAQMANIVNTQARTKHTNAQRTALEQTYLHQIDAIKSQTALNRVKHDMEWIEYGVKSQTQRDAIEQIRVRVELDKARHGGQLLQNEFKQYSNNLAQIGIYPSDPIYWRVLGQKFGGESGFTNLTLKDLREHAIKGVGLTLPKITPRGLTY